MDDTGLTVLKRIYHKGKPLLIPSENIAPNHAEGIIYPLIFLLVSHLTIMDDAGGLTSA